LLLDAPDWVQRMILKMSIKTAVSGVLAIGSKCSRFAPKTKYGKLEALFDNRIPPSHYSLRVGAFQLKWP
jgi:hypothetical protein